MNEGESTVGPDEPARVPEHEQVDNPAEEVTSSENAGGVRWLIPAVLILVITWALATIPGMLRPLTFVHFVSMQAAPAIGAIALIVWWITARRLPTGKSLLAVTLTIGLYVLTMMLVHKSMAIPMYIYGLPVALTLLILGMLVAGRSRWPKQGWVGFIVFAGFLLASLFFRVGQVDAAFAFNLVPRWTPTAEEKFLASRQASLDTEETGAEVALPTSDEGLIWADFRGPERKGVVSGVGLSTDWKSNPPKELWRRSVGPGWSSFCIAGPLLITQEQYDQEEAVVAYNQADGKIIWTHQFPGRFEASMGGIGPRATPTYRDGKLFVTGASGVIYCLDAANGKPIWEFNLIEELEVRLPDWGFASSPLVLDDKVMVVAGGGEDKGTVALSRETGELIWSAGNGSHSYSSAQLSVIHDTPQVLVASDKGVHSFNPDDGTVLWQHEWNIAPMARVTQPMVVNNAVYLGTGYGNGTMRFDVMLDGDAWSTEERWIAPLKPYFNDAVYHKGFIYGFDGPIFMCLNAEDGDKAWKRGRYGHGQVLLIEDQQLLLVLSEKGELVLVKADPNKHQEIAKLDSMEGITWNHPVIANGKLFVRNAQEMVCYEI